MPILNAVRDDLFQRIEENWGAKPNEPSEKADTAFDELCFSFGIELDDVTTEKMMKQKETGVVDSSASEDIIYKIDMPANRADLLCVEGLSRALRVFLQKDSPPEYRLVKPKQMQRMIIKKEVQQIRPHVVCAVLRNVKFNNRSYQSFIDFQEKLHQNICRKRTLVSIGTHDLDTIQGPFTYEALPPKDINFVPLNQKKSMDGHQLMAHLSNDLHLKKYLPIIQNSPVYPVIYDKNRRVLSLPPIINGDHSKITLNTKNVFIEVTATDLTKAHIVLNLICAMFSEYCADKFTIEPVEVEDADGKVTVYPDISPRELETTVDYITSSIGIECEAEEIVKLLSRMSLTSKLLPDKKTIKVSIPCTRSDVLHACDVMEDAAIAYGFNNIARPFPPTLTHGKQQPLNKLTDLLRAEVAMAGYSEILTLSLCSIEETYKMLNRPNDGNAVRLANPKTEEFEIARVNLLVGLLKTIASNKSSALPIKIFEISDVVHKDNTTDVGAFNERRLCAIYCSHNSGFEIVHGLLDHIMKVNNVTWKKEGVPCTAAKYYYLKPSEDGAFFPGRRADVYLNDKKIGVLGIIHPEVVTNYKIPFACTALEISIEPFL